MSFTFLATILAVGYSIFMLWRVSMLWREEGRLLPYVPFFLWGILINVLGAFIFYDMLFTFWWFTLDFAFFICYAFLLIVLVRLINELHEKL